MYFVDSTLLFTDFFQFGYDKFLSLPPPILGKEKYSHQFLPTLTYRFIYFPAILSAIYALKKKSYLPVPFLITLWITEESRTKLLAVRSLVAAHATSPKGMERTPMQHSSKEIKYICIMIQWLDSETQRSCPWRTASSLPEVAAKSQKQLT